MFNDNVYPNNGEYFTAAPPVEQKKAVAKQNQETLEQLPLLKELIARLEARITFYDTLSSIPDHVLSNPEEFMHHVAANKKTSENLKIERGFLLARLNDATR